MSVHKAFVGTYTRRDAEGIYAATFDDETGAFELGYLAAALPNPSYLAQAGNDVYAVLEDEQGEVAALRRDGNTLTLLNRKPSMGSHPCHISVVADRVAVANYSSGSVTLLTRSADGALGDICSVEQHAGHGPNARRQSGPHAHMVYPDPWAKRLFVPDLGCDRLYRYGIERGVLQLEGFTGLPAGAGPRHVVAHPTLRGTYYVINELDNTIVRVAPGNDGRFAVESSVATLPDDAAVASATAALRIHPNGHRLYATNRGADSFVAVTLDRDGAFGSRTLVPTLGEHPRDLTLDPSASWLLAANQDSDTVTVYALEDGLPVNASATTTRVPTPVCILFTHEAHS